MFKSETLEISKPKSHYHLNGFSFLSFLNLHFQSRLTINTTSFVQPFLFFYDAKDSDKIATCLRITNLLPGSRYAIDMRNPGPVKAHNFRKLNPSWKNNNIFITLNLKEIIFLSFSYQYQLCYDERSSRHCFSPQIDIIERLGIFQIKKKSSVEE